MEAGFWRNQIHMAHSSFFLVSTTHCARPRLTSCIYVLSHLFPASFLFSTTRDGDGQCFEPRSIDEERVANGQAGVVCSVRSRGNGTGLIVPRNPDHSPTSASVHASASAPLVSVSPLRPSTPSEVAPTGPNFIKVNYSSFENRDAGDEDAGSPV